MARLYKSHPSILVIGIGNTLRGDDAIGPLAAERIAGRNRSDRLRVITQQGLVPELAADLAEVDAVLFLDASYDPQPNRVELRPVLPPRMETSGAGRDGSAISHRLTPTNLLAMTQTLFGRSPRAACATVHVTRFELSDATLSPAALELLDELVEAAEAWLQAATQSAPRG